MQQVDPPSCGDRLVFFFVSAISKADSTWATELHPAAAELQGWRTCGVETWRTCFETMGFFEDLLLLNCILNMAIDISKIVFQRNKKK